MTTHRLVLWVSLIAAMTAACAGPGANPPSTMTTTTLMSGWEQHFTVEWADEGQNGARRVTGHVYASKGDAEGVRLLAQALDASGAVISQRIAYVPGSVGSGGAYFEVPNLPTANAYRVSVWDYTSFNSKTPHR